MAISARMKKSSTASPRSSPLLQFFASATSKSNNNSKSPATTTSPTGGGDNDSTASSTIIRSLSACFDGGVSSMEMEDNDVMRLNDEERAAIDKARKIGVDDSKNNTNNNCGGRHQWGPTHSYTSEDSTNKPSKKSIGGGFGSLNNLFKPVASNNNSKSPTNDMSVPASPSKNSHGTDPTAPVTSSTTTGEGQHQSQQFSMKTGMIMTDPPMTPGNDTHRASAATSANMTSAAMGGGASAAVIANFWNNHAQPATACGSGGDGLMYSPSSASSMHSTASSPLSTSAKAAADAVLGIFFKAENFLATSTGVSPASGGGFCSPRNSPDSNSSLAAMEGIPEGEDEDRGDNTFCGKDNHCFEFEDFGFNAFQEDDRPKQTNGAVAGASSSSSPVGGETDKKSSQLPPSDGPPEPQQQPNKGYEIRLKSTFSRLEVQTDQSSKKQPAPAPQQPPAAFGRTHPNKNYKKSISHPIQTQVQPLQDYSDVPQGGSRALPDGLPFRELSVPTEIERSVSELTMRSHGAFERHRYTSDSRRMAYYAVGRTTGDQDGNNNNKSAGGGNRRCYFTGNGIPYGMPFYAGSVQQGPRTLVVFCLPSALGLPMFSDLHAMQQKTFSRYSNKADQEKYLEALPEPDTKLLHEMSKRYPEPFDTLPVQVRSPHCWRLFVKFCFFSGLPIAEGEMHYRVKSSVTVFPPNSTSAQQQQGEEIALSHEVMEAVNGEVSAEILRLPNQKVFDYLKRQYSQQSSKLNDEAFDRKSWELVMPEV